MNGISLRCYLSAPTDDELEKIEFSEISLWPGINKTYPLKSKQNQPTLLRNQSGINFTDNESLTFTKIDDLLINSFCSVDDSYRNRPYPSGGALYSIDVFLCKLSENIYDWPSKSSILHLLPATRSLEDTDITINSTTLLSHICGENAELLGKPHFAIIYTLFFPKAIFKYRHRGYRLAHLEAGSMYQMADLQSKKLNLRNRVWAGFSDYQIAKTLELNPKYVMPLIVQFFGNVEKK